jgi:dienelactone hydrolase
VNGSALLIGWSDLRRAYWGFGPEALPLNGRVWYPVGDGPFPLVLVVHGNHAMEEFSDTGYDYLGNLLASRGFIVASVDENFLNYSLAADLLTFTALQNENGTRAWLLLEHLAAWRTWNQTPGNPFFGKVDLDSVALIGHSRGGEAVAIAAAFNRLPFDPDDATVAFNYGFGIRSVIAIAPIDKQYQPAGRPTPLRDVNYLVLHGSHDMQAPMFFGAEQYERVQFSGDQFTFKAGLYIYGANHGQFNTVWGRQDNPLPAGWLYNTRQLLPADQQAQIAKVYIAGFLEATLHDQLGYLPLFRDHRSAPDWLPDTIMLHQYMDTSTRLVATFEDLDVSATTPPGGHVEGQNLTVWRQGTVLTRINALPWAHARGPRGVPGVGRTGLGWRASSCLQHHPADGASAVDTRRRARLLPG